MKGAIVKDSSRDQLPILFKDRGYTVGAEIGVYKAAFTKKFCEVGLKMYAIDPWVAYRSGGRSQNIQKRQDFLCGHATRTLAPYDAVVIRKTSMDALADFKDRSLDFVYIDGRHTFRYIAEDISEWTRKVKIGGIVSGHDYFTHLEYPKHISCSVQVVVDAYVKRTGKKLVVFGRIKNPKIKDDFYNSWLFVK